MEVITGHCGKCGAPYTQPQIWHGVTPPPITPTCSCWNIPRTKTTNTSNFSRETNL